MRDTDESLVHRARAVGEGRQTCFLSGGGWKEGMRWVDGETGPRRRGRRRGSSCEERRADLGEPGTASANARRSMGLGRCMDTLDGERSCATVQGTCTRSTSCRLRSLAAGRAKVQGHPVRRRTDCRAAVLAGPGLRCRGGAACRES